MAKPKFRDLIEKIPKLPRLQEGGIVTKSTLTYICQDRGNEIPLNRVQIEGEFPSEEQARLFISMLEDLPAESIFIFGPSEPKDDLHEKRECFNCHREIGFTGFYIRNKDMTKEQLEKIWESPYIELYCCSCFRKEENKEESLKKREKLLNKAERICEKFGYDLEWAKSAIKEFGKD